MTIKNDSNIFSNNNEVNDRKELIYYKGKLHLVQKWDDHLDKVVISQGLSGKTFSIPQDDIEEMKTDKIDFYNAVENGKIAFSEGKFTYDNPYTHNSEERFAFKDWQYGFLSAKKSNLDTKEDYHTRFFLVLSRYLESKAEEENIDKNSVAPHDKHG